jgi:hypothetical protein
VDDVRVEVTQIPPVDTNPPDTRPVDANKKRKVERKTVVRIAYSDALHAIAVCAIRNIS